MERKALKVALLGVILSLILHSQAFAAELDLNGIVMTVPDSWIQTKNETEDNGDVTIQYTCASGGIMFVYTSGYSEDVAEFSSLLLDTLLSGLQDEFEGYQEYESQELTIDGCNAHATTFYCDDGLGVLLAVDTGRSIVNLLYFCTDYSENEFDEFGEVIDSIRIGDTGGDSESEAESESTKYSAGNYKVGIDIPAGEYILFTSGGQSGYFCVSSDSNQADILFNENFEYNSIITINEGEYLEMNRCYAIPADADPNVDLSGTGMFKVGTHIETGEYQVDSGSESGYYCIYSSSRQDDIVANDIFTGKNYVTVSEGQYLVLKRCAFTETPEKPIKSYTDQETVLRVQEGLNLAGYDCGTPDGIIGSTTSSQITLFQEDNGLTVTGTITDEVLESLEAIEEETPESTLDTDNLAEGMTEQSGSSTEPSGETTEQAEPTTELSEKATEQTEPSTELPKETTEQVEPSTELSEETTEQVELSTELSEETTEQVESSTELSEKINKTEMISSSQVNIIESDSDLEIRKAGYTINDGYLYYAIDIYNKSVENAIMFPAYRYTARDGDGNVISTEEQILNIIYPGQNYIWAGLGGDIQSAPETVDFELLSPDSYNIIDASTLNEPIYVPLEVENSTCTEDEIWGVNFVGEIYNPNEYDIDQAYVCVVLKDKDGVMLGGDFTFVDDLKSNNKTPFEITCTADIPFETYECYANSWD